MELSKEYFDGLFTYKDGSLYWKESRKGAKAGDKAGGLYGDGYISLTVNKKRYLAHRIIFLMRYGYLPDMIDHIDGDRTNNRIENLRAATRAQNAHNFGLSAHNKSGHRNVHWSNKDNRWRVHLRYNGKRISIGSFVELNDAVEAARQARQKYHGEFAHGTI